MRVASLALLILGCSEAATPPPPTFTPYEPGRPSRPAVDDPYVQETNHPFSNDVRLPPLVAIFDPPAAYAALGEPMVIAERGYVVDAFGAPEPRSFQGLNEDLVSAAASGTSVFLASRGTLFELSTDGTTRTASAGLAILGLSGGAAGAFVRLDDALGFIGPGGALRRIGPAASAVVEVGDSVFVARDGRIIEHDTAVDGLGAERRASAALEIGEVRAMVVGATFPRAMSLVAFGDTGAVALGDDLRPIEAPELARGRVPLPEPRRAILSPDGGVLVVTGKGAMRTLDRGDGVEWRVYGAERWIPSEDVRDAYVSEDRTIWLASALGLSHVTRSTITLEEKLEGFVDRITARHDRDGAVADSHLTVKGDLSTNIPWDSDNDGSWTSYWLMAECFRWKVTQAPDAKANFDRSLDAMLRLRDVTGTDHFLARALIRKEGCRLDDCDDPDDGKWYTSPDGVWWVKRDTSNDEVIAHVFMMGHLHDLCADSAQKARIVDHIGGIVGGIVDHGFQLIDPVTNMVTTYGQFDPAYVNESLPGIIGDGGQRSAITLASLTLAYYLTGDEKFAAAKAELITRHKYADNAVREAEYEARGGSGDGDEMSTYAWFVLLRYEPDPALRARWEEGWSRTHVALAKQQGAWWDLVNAQLGGSKLELERAKRWLQRAPVDMIRWDMKNSVRLDLAPPPEPYDPAGRMRSDGKIIPYDERRCDRWNTDQFKVDGGMGGVVEMDGADVLAPYWMARYYGFIVR